MADMAGHYERAQTSVSVQFLISAVAVSTHRLPNIDTDYLQDFELGTVQSEQHLILALSSQSSWDQPHPQIAIPQGKKWSGL